MVIELGLIPTLYKEPRIRWGSGSFTTYIGAYEIFLRITDSSGLTKNISSVFYTLERDNSDLLLGIPGLKEAGIILNARDRRWNFLPVGESPAIRIVEVEEVDDLIKEDEYY
jgi:hypothetical protein